MTNIEYFPKFYERKDILEKQKQLEICIKELLDSGKLTQQEIEELEIFDLRECAHAYDRNYVIGRIKEMQNLVNWRQEEKAIVIYLGKEFELGKKSAELFVKYNKDAKIKEVER